MRVGSLVGVNPNYLMSKNLFIFHNICLTGKSKTKTKVFSHTFMKKPDSLIRHEAILLGDQQLVQNFVMSSFGKKDICEDNLYFFILFSG